MTFATPLIAGLIAAIAVPTLIILYFLKLRRAPLEVSTTLLWKKSIQDIQANAPFQRLRKNILLLLQLLVLAALIFALAQPRSDQGSIGGQRIVLMLDRSASMSSTDGDDSGTRSRLDEAKQRAIEIVESLEEPGVLKKQGSEDLAMVVAFDAAAEIIQPFTTDKRALIDAINSVQTTDAPTSIAEAYRLAQAQRPKRQFTDNAGGTQADQTLELEGLVGGPGYTFHLFSDGRIPDADVFKADAEQQGAPPTFEYHSVGKPDSHNVGITALRAERAFDNPTRLSVFVGLQGTEPTPRNVDVELLISGRIVSVRTVTIPGAVAAEPGAPARPSTGGVVFELDEPNGVQITARLPGIGGTVGNALDTDDEGILIVPPAKRSAVALVTTGSLFLQGALPGLPLSRFDVLTPGEYESRRVSGALNQYDVIVLDRYLPLPNEAGSVLDPGRYLIFGAVPPPPIGVESLPVAGASAIINWRRNHPALRELTLDGLVIGKARPMRIPDGSGAVSLADTPEGPAIVEVSEGTVRAIIASFDLAETNWPFQIGFVVYLGSAIEYLSGNTTDADGAGDRQIKPGGVLADRVPADARNLRVMLPKGGSQELVPSLDGRVVYGPVRDEGVYRLEWSGTPGATDLVEGPKVTRFFAANLLDPQESDITPADTLGLADRTVQAQRAGTGGVLELWPYLVLAGLAIMLLEWWIYNKRVSL
jgi:hypothetical protein